MESKSLEPKRFAVVALIDVGVSGDAFVTGRRTLLHSHEEANVKVYCQTEQRFHLLAMLVCYGVYSVEDHSKSHFVAVCLAKWR